MAWLVKGTARHVIMGHGRVAFGPVSIWGGGVHEPEPILHTHADVDFSCVQSADCAWAVLSSDISDADAASLPRGLVHRARETPTDPHSSIRFIDNPPQVAFTVMLPPVRFTEAFELFRTVLLGSQLGFLISVEFPGFRTEHSSAIKQTAHEFLAGKPVFQSHASFAIGQRFFHQ